MKNMVTVSTRSLVVGGEKAELEVWRLDGVKNSDNDTAVIFLDHLGSNYVLMLPYNSKNQSLSDQLLASITFTK